MLYIWSIFNLFIFSFSFSFSLILILVFLGLYLVLTGRESDVCESTLYSRDGRGFDQKKKRDGRGDR